MHMEKEKPNKWLGNSKTIKVIVKGKQTTIIFLF